MDWAKREEEIEASLDLEWRIFAQAHNAAGKRPRCMYKGMVLDDMDEMHLVNDGEVEANYLIDMNKEAFDRYTASEKGR